MRTKYQIGRNKEYKISNNIALEYGYRNMTEANKSSDVIILRSAGSHSPIDVIVIDRVGKLIKLIQSKRTINMKVMDVDSKLKEEIEKDNQDLNGLFRVEFNCY